MMNQTTRIADYYFTHIDELPLHKQFHFATRMAAWFGDERALEVLRACRATLVPQPTDDATLETLFAQLVAENAPDNIPGYRLRAPMFEQFPTLYGIHQALFRLRHLQCVYGIDARPVFGQVAPASMLRDLDQQLQANPEAQRILSTYAVNFRYLTHILFGTPEPVDASELYTIGQTGYNLQDVEQSRLQIYLYTHCIIADSNFYTRPLPQGSLATYTKMLRYLEQRVTESFDNYSLDTKLEFLVCCRIAQITTDLEQRVLRECSRSLSPDGDFIVDTHNAFAGHTRKKTFAASEHRNVLYTMASTPYTPHSTLV